jgi:GNAT superfamily N-acetyltransferase
MIALDLARGLKATVRETDESDSALVALRSLAGHDLAAPDETEVRGLDAYQWIVEVTLQSTDSHQIGLIASLNESAVGMGMIVRTREHALLHSVYVAPAFRGIGIGRSIVLAGRQAAQDDRLLALALPGDRQIKNLFEQAGMPAQILVAG